MYVEYMFHILKVFVNVLLHYCLSLSGSFLERLEGLEKRNKEWKKILHLNRLASRFVDRS